ncbi:hypothetical protein [Nannocystis pusilla]|uniref:nSTAND1 domain-containing NTPase n=1 Tax=Nannocystis pusilla TaxID=889268 RepID=UPI003B7F45FD
MLVVDGIEAAIDSDEKGQREGFAAVLAHALAHSTGPFLLITPIRSRYLGELHRLPQLHERMVGHHAPPVLYALAPMDADQLRQVIRGPGERAGHVVAERLVERILADLEDLATKQAPPPGIALALLAAALSETYRNMQQGELCVTAYEAAGGLTGAVERFAERTLARALDEFSERWVRELFLMVIDGQIDQRWVRHPLQLPQVLESLDRRFRQSAPHVPPRTLGSCFSGCRDRRKDCFRSRIWPSRSCMTCCCPIGHVCVPGRRCTGSLHQSHRQRCRSTRTWLPQRDRRVRSSARSGRYGRPRRRVRGPGPERPRPRERPRQRYQRHL